MSKITVNRCYYKDCTISRIAVNTFKCFGLELPWLGNTQNVSCILEGVYKYYVAISPSSNMKVLWIVDVPDRELIQVHAGNYTKQILGCLLVGSSLTYLDSDSIIDVTNSVATLEKLVYSVNNTGTIYFTSECNSPNQLNTV